jgi:carbamoyltransferase
MYSDAILARLNSPRVRSEPLSQYHRDLAASAQKQLEAALLSLVQWTVRTTGARNLCLAGGTMLNCSAAGVIGRSGLVDQIYIPPSASDAGTALGAALLAAREFELPAPEPVRHAAWGTSYTDDEVEAALKLAQLPYQLLDDVPTVTADLIASGKVVGWFQDRMEFGPRALGFRSILGDPRSSRMRELINAKIKFREEFRPFAPSVLEEHARSWFPDAAWSPFMTVAFQATARTQTVVPAVVHVNGTSRVQTVPVNYPGQYRALIEAFHAITGVPMVLNTSFNRQGEPIVESPLDAVSTFYGSGLDALVINRFLVMKG